jgi:hypothetical protein
MQLVLALDGTAVQRSGSQFGFIVLLKRWVLRKPFIKRSFRQSVNRLEVIEFSIFSVISNNSQKPHQARDHRFLLSCVDIQLNVPIAQYVDVESLKTARGRSVTCDDTVAHIESHKVEWRKNTNQLFIVDNKHSVNAVLVHQVGRIAQVVLRTNRDDVARHCIAN